MTTRGHAGKSGEPLDPDTLDPFNDEMGGVLYDDADLDPDLDESDEDELGEEDD